MQREIEYLVTETKEGPPRTFRIEVGDFQPKGPPRGSSAEWVFLPSKESRRLLLRTVVLEAEGGPADELIF